MMGSKGPHTFRLIGVQFVIEAGDMRNGAAIEVLLDRDLQARLTIKARNHLSRS